MALSVGSTARSTDEKWFPIACGPTSGVSERTVSRIVQEKKQGQVQSPKTAKRSEVMNTIIINDFELRHLRDTDHCNTYISGENVKL